jgi:hypothetical protein
MDLRLSKSHAGQRKRQIRINYDWDGEEANLVDLVSSLLRNICFHVLSFLRTDGWNITKDRTAFQHFYRGR